MSDPNYFPKMTRTALKRKVPKSCPDRKEHVRVALLSGQGFLDCTHDGVMIDPNVARWYATPAGKHKRVAPRWFGMDVGNNGKITVRDADDEELLSEFIEDMEYASTTIIWEDRLPSSEI